MGRVDAIFNLAVILSDFAIENFTPDTFRIAIPAKMLVTKYLDEVSKKLCPDLR